MTLVGFRIDDRLLHGQVVENWIERLRPDLIIVASDRAAADPLTRELQAAAMPPRVGLEVVALDGAPAAAARGRGRVFVIAGSPADALVLVESGLRPPEIVVGGLHHEGGKERLLDFVYVDENDRAHLRRILELGLKLVAQDVPQHRARDLAPLLADAAGGGCDEQSPKVKNRGGHRVGGGG